MAPGSSAGATCRGEREQADVKACEGQGNMLGKGSDGMNRNSALPCPQPPLACPPLGPHSGHDYCGSLRSRGLCCPHPRATSGHCVHPTERALGVLRAQRNHWERACWVMEALLFFENKDFPSLLPRPQVAVAVQWQPGPGLPYSNGPCRPRCTSTCAEE